MSERSSTPSRKNTDNTLVGSPRRTSTAKTLVESPGDKGQLKKDSPTQHHISDAAFVASPTSSSEPPSVLSPSTAASASWSPSSKTLTSSSPDAAKSRKWSWLPTMKTDRSGERYEDMRSTAFVIAKASLSFAEASNIPYLKGVAGLALLILEYSNGVTANKEDCCCIVNRVTHLLTILDRKAKDKSYSASKTLEDQVGHLNASLERVCMDVKKLSDSKRRYLRRLISQERDKEIIKRCDAELDNALKIFSFQSLLEIQTDLLNGQTQIGSPKDHMEGTRKIALSGIRSFESSQEAIMPGTVSPRRYEALLEQRDQQRLSNLPTLPAPPAIFYGRDEIFERMIRGVTQSMASRIAVLGPGGIGKTSLALHVLHHKDVEARYKENRFFIPCDSATSVESLISLIASHAGLSDGFEKVNVRTGEIETAILACLSGVSNSTSSQPVIIILDNLESSWEPDRSGVEKFLARLAALETVTLVVTLRGVERPSNIQWDKPLLPSLRTLTPQAARKVFISISDAEYKRIYDEDNRDELDELLSLCDHLPLAIRLMAELAVPEIDTVPGLIQKWKRAARCTSILNIGDDANHSVELSIELSLSSPRMKRAPEAIILLGLLAHLPDGIREDDLARAVPDIINLNESQNALVRTSLVYIDRPSNRLKVLAPIRAYLTSSAEYKPRSSLTESLREYFWALIKQEEGGYYGEKTIKRVLPELGNIENLIERAFFEDFAPFLAVSAVARLGRFFLEASLGKPRLLLLEKALKISRQMQCKRLEADCLYTLALTNLRFFNVHHDTSTCYNDFKKASELYEQLGDEAGQGHCLHQLGAVHHGLRQLEDARDITLKAIQLHLRAGCLGGQASALLNLSKFHHLLNEAEKAIKYAHESLQLLRNKHHDPITEARCLQYLGVIHCSTFCNYIDAAELLEESHRIYKALQLEDSTNCMDTVVSQGELAYIRSNFDEAKDAFQKAATIYHKKNRRDYEANALTNLGLACLGLGAPEEALMHIHRGLKIWEEIPNKWGIGISYIALGDVDAKRDAIPGAERCYEKALDSFRLDSSQWKSFEAECLLKMGILLIRTRQVAEARERLQEAMQLYDAPGCRRGKTNCLRYLAELDLEIDNRALKREALARLEGVEKEYSEMGLYMETQQCAAIIFQMYRSLGEKQTKGLVVQI